MEERATFKFFRSFYESALQLDSKEHQADFLMAICGYALDGKIPDIQGTPAAMFILSKPNLDASRVRAESGSAGGSASKREANRKQNSSKPQAKLKQNSSEEGSRKKEEGSKEVGSIDTPLPPSESTVQLAENVTMTNDEYQKLLAAHGPADTARLVEILDNYKGSSGKKYKSDYRAILSWCVDRLREEQKHGMRPHSGNVFLDMLQEGHHEP